METAFHIGAKYFCLHCLILKNQVHFIRIFSNVDFVATEPNKAAYPVTMENFSHFI